ncbi:MAG: hypothetical protein QOD94_1954, partial [Alphaproteobacteria bacterium]|nr:hypothetical protein [Alphaproteobacteria bacterium]
RGSGVLKSTINPSGDVLVQRGRCFIAEEIAQLRRAAA